MPKKSKRNAAISPGRRIQNELGLDAREWSVGVGYHKGILSGSRYTSVYVMHRPSGRQVTSSFYAAGKAAARREALSTAKELIAKLR